MKVLYYITVTLSAIILAAYLLFGGVSGVYYVMIKNGYFSSDMMEKMFQRKYEETMLFNQLVGVFFFGSLILCSLLPFLPIKPVNKHRISFVALVILLCIIFIPRIIRWKYGYVYY